MITMGKKFKKSMAMAMATAMALSVPVLPVYQAEKVEAAKADPASFSSEFNYVKFSEEGEAVYVDQLADDDSKILYYAVTTANKVDSLKESAYEAVKWDGSATIDLSWVNRKKDQVLCLATGASIAEVKPFVVDMPAQQSLYVTYSGTADKTKKETAKFGEEGATMIGDDENGYLSFAMGASKTAVSASAIEYRTVNSAWKNVEDDFDLAYYSSKGATLQMRVAPEGGYTYSASKKAEAEDSKEKYEPKYDGFAAGKAVNVKIKAKAAAPKATVNFNDKVVNVPAKAEYYNEDEEKWKVVSSDGKKATVAFEKYGWTGEDEKVIWYRIAGTDKKAPSKIKYVTIKEEEDTFTSLTAPASGASIGTAPAYNSNKFEVGYKTPYDAKTALVFTNATNYTYQVGFVKDADLKDAKTGENEDKLIAASGSAIVKAKDGKVEKWVTVKAQDSKKNKVSTATLALPKDAKNLTPEQIAKTYKIVYRICDTEKGTRINSETRIMNVPGVVKQDIAIAQDNKVVTTVEIGTTSSAGITATVSAGGISAKGKYTVGVYTSKECTTKYTKLKAKLSGTTLTIKPKSGIVAGTYYVQVKVEGVSTVLEVKVFTSPATT